MTQDFRQRALTMTVVIDFIGAEGVSLSELEDLTRQADSHQDIKLGFQLRKGIVQAAIFSGRCETALVAFAWRLAQCDREPAKFSERDLLWEYKWIVGRKAPRFPQIPLQQIEEMLADMSRRYERNGASLRPIWKLRCSIARETGNTDAARRCYAQWQKTPVGWPSDCTACDCASEIRFLNFVGKYEEALEKAVPIFQGRLKCATVPQGTLAQGLLPLMRLGRHAEAMRYHHRGYRMVTDNPKMLDECGCHLRFLVLTDHPTRAVKLLEKHLPLGGAQTMELDARLDLLTPPLAFLMARLHASGKSSLKLRLPSGFAVTAKAGRFDILELKSWFDAETRDLATRFDVRNGNDFYMRRFANEQNEWTRLVRPWPLRGQPKAE